MSVAAAPDLKLRADTYNSDNLPIAITDANGGEKTLAYNPDSQVTSYTDCSGEATQWKYNALGQLAKLINAAGEVTEYQYEAGQLVLLIRMRYLFSARQRSPKGLGNLPHCARQFFPQRHAQAF
ncbi:RHS repeat protein [Pseudomonas putida]|nr:RHS repeat protein [Pseudomonas putida]